jgi:hypothetical protein
MARGAHLFVLSTDRFGASSGGGGGSSCSGGGSSSEKWCQIFSV